MASVSCAVSVLLHGALTRCGVWSRFAAPSGYYEERRSAEASLGRPTEAAEAGAAAADGSQPHGHHRKGSRVGEGAGEGRSVGVVSIFLSYFFVSIFLSFF